MRSFLIGALIGVATWAPTWDVRLAPLSMLAVLAACTLAWLQGYGDAERASGDSR